MTKSKRPAVRTLEWFGKSQAVSLLCRGLLTRASVLQLFAILIVGAPRSAAGGQREPVYEEIPGLTTPRTQTVAVAEEAIPAVSQSPQAAQTVPAKPAPAGVVAQATQVTDHAQGKTLYSFTANGLELKVALATFARANNLNIVPDNDIVGTITVDVRDLPLEQMMRALLEASDCTWHEEGGLIRVRNAETRMFNVDYLRLERRGREQSSATLNSATIGGSGGGAGGGSSGGGAGAAGGAGGASAGGSSVNINAENPTDFWREVQQELDLLLTDKGKGSMAINKTAGLIQITDRPSALQRVEQYLSGVDRSLHRQVEIEAKIYDVTLNDQFQFGIDWVHVAEAYGGLMGFGASTLPEAIGSLQAKDSALSGLNTAPGMANPFTLVFTNFNTSAAVNALKQQGNVEVIAKPRIRTLNNQTAMIKVGTETPFFAETFQANQSQSGNQTFSGDQITTVTIGTILSITPQISGDNWVCLDISPVLTGLEATIKSPSGTATAPVLDTKQASTLVRVRDGTTIIIGGLIQTQRARNDKKVPLLGDIPGVGKLFTGTFRYKEKKELVIFVTPHIVGENETSVASNPEKNMKW